MASPLHLSVLSPSFSSCKPSLFSSPCKPSRLHSHTCASVSSSSSSSISLTSHKPVAASLIEKLGGFKGVKWGDLWSLNSWVVRDYYRLVDSVNALEQIVRRLSDEQSGLFAAEIKDSRVSAAIESRGDFLIASYLQVVEDSGYDNTYIREVEREVMVKSLDCFWRDHLINMNRLSSAVNVRSFGHRNPLEEYKIDGCRFFISMLSATRRLTVESLLQYWSSPVNSEELFSI